MLLYPRARKGDYYLPNSLVSIYDGCFDNCTELTAFIVQEDNPAFSALDGTLFNKDKTVLVRRPLPVSDSFPLPNGLMEIAPMLSPDAKGVSRPL